MDARIKVKLDYWLAQLRANREMFFASGRQDDSCLIDSQLLLAERARIVQKINRLIRPVCPRNKVDNLP